MKRQHSSGSKSILHFFQSVPRTSQGNSPATADSSADNVSPPSSSTGSTGAVRVQSTQSSSAGPAVSFASNTSTIEDASIIDTVMTSTETLPPNTSQTSANSGASKRIVSGGQHVVLNSDSDSDSMGELNFGLPTPKPQAPTYTGRPTRSKMSLDEPGLRKPPKSAKNTGKRFFNRLMETAQKNIDTEKKIQEHKADLEKIIEEPKSIPASIDKDALKQAIRDEEGSDQADRLYKAMQRTNEVHMQTAYHFFDHDPELSLRPSFPHRCLPDHGWVACFEEPHARDQAFMTGFAQQIFRLQELPEELAAWMLDQVYSGYNAALDEKYIEILLTHDDRLQKLLTSNFLDVMFNSIGARVDSLDDGVEIYPSEAQADSQWPLPSSLKRIVGLLTNAAPCMNAKARIHAFHLLCYTCLDDRILLDPDTLEAVRDAIEAVICHYADNCKLTSGVGSPLTDDVHSLITSQLAHVIPNLLSRVTNPLLQENLIYSFPSRSPLTAYLQRHLALSFLLHPLPVNLPLADPELPTLIHRYLETSSHWHMSKNTNYSFVAARLALLDVAIGPGLLEVPYLPLVSPTSSEAGSPTPLSTSPNSSEVEAFNKEVDALSQLVKLLGNSIVETGAALDLTILKAKERCERVFWRLQHAVRVGGKKAENVFGDGEDGKQMKVKRFFKPLAKKSAPVGSVFDQDGDAGSPM